ncbi:MAG: inorganic diphosphatase [Alphaproteobacteria bacterium]|nr:inorganic diphosphatase [Alphaproteobacteria bacterium]
MDIDKISIGKKSPEEVNVVIENPMGGTPVKYELDKESGALFVDRFLHTPMFYPGNYGFVPQTLGGDGDPVDVLVFGLLPVLPGSVLPSRIIGVLKMEDDGGQDEKIIAVPTTKMYPYHDNINEVTDLPEIVRQQIEHFFVHYKDLEKGKWSKVLGWGDKAEAISLIKQGIENAKDKLRVLPLKIG